MVLDRSGGSGAVRLLGAAAALLLTACMGSPPDAQAGAQEGAGAPGGPPAAGTPVQADSADPRWAAIRRVFAQEGDARDGYFRVDFPRTDFRVRIGGTTLDPEFDLTSYFGFAPAAGDSVMGMGEVILRQEEVTRALAEASRRGVGVMALHNHLLGEEPRIVYMHVMAEGPADSVAARLRSVIATTATPLRREGGEERAAADWSAIDSVLGPHAEAGGRTAEYVFPRREAHSIHGMAVKSTGILETASEVVFQQLGGGRVASTGELYVRPEEVQPVIRALETAGLHVTALHNHMLDERPTMYWIHWYGTGDGSTLARGVSAALSHMNSARRSVRESG